MGEELDPSIAALLADAEKSKPEDVPDMKTVEKVVEKKKTAGFFGSKSASVSEDKYAGKTIHDVDLGIREFKPAGKMLSDVPSTVFDDTTYYKTALTNENESAQRVHAVLSKYLTCTDPKTRSVYRQNLITAYWELLRGMAPKSGSLQLPMPKRMLMRFGVLLPSLFKPEQKVFFSRINFTNLTGEPILYMDEWFKEILSGRMRPSMTDEKRPAHKLTQTGDEADRSEQMRLTQLQSKNSGKLQSAENLLNL